jgi:hypothetical protein
MNQITDARLYEMLSDSRQEEAVKRAEAGKRHQAEQATALQAMRDEIRVRKAAMREVINLAIAKGRIPGKPADYTVCLPTIRGNNWVSPSIGHPKIRTRLFPQLDLRVTAYEDYPHHAELDAISQEVGFYVEGSA